MRDFFAALKSIWSCSVNSLPDSILCFKSRIALFSTFPPLSLFLSIDLAKLFALDFSDIARPVCNIFSLSSADSSISIFTPLGPPTIPPIAVPTIPWYTASAR